MNSTHQLKCTLSFTVLSTSPVPLDAWSLKSLMKLRTTGLSNLVNSSRLPEALHMKSIGTIRQMKRVEILFSSFYSESSMLSSMNFIILCTSIWHLKQSNSFIKITPTVPVSKLNHILPLFCFRSEISASRLWPSLLGCVSSSTYYYFSISCPSSIFCLLLLYY